MLTQLLAITTTQKFPSLGVPPAPLNHLEEDRALQRAVPVVPAQRLSNFLLAKLVDGSLILQGLAVGAGNFEQPYGHHQHRLERAEVAVDRGDKLETVRVVGRQTAQPGADKHDAYRLQGKPLEAVVEVGGLAGVEIYEL